ncbi:MAG: anti-sigma factor [Calditrichaceae bacterium]
MTTQTKKIDKYNCADIEKHVHAYIDGVLNAEETRLFNEHLDYCLPCDKKIEFEKRLKEVVRLKSKDNTPVDRLKLRIDKMLTDLL